MTVASEPGRGTTFEIHLPFSNKKMRQNGSRKERLIKGAGTVLLVDDEAMIIEVGQAMLAHLGYRVMVAHGGEEAVETVRKMGNEIDLVLLDMIMPEMDGGKTFDAIRKISPGLPVILSSGYAIDGQAEKIMGRGCNGFIQKPFNISKLSGKIREVMDRTKN